MKEWKRFTAFLLSLLIIVTSVDVSSLVSSASNSTVTSPNATITSPNTPEGEPEDPENLEGLGDLEDLGDSEETTYTYCVTDLSATAQMELKWLTNLLPETVPAIPFTLYYQIDSGEELLFATIYADGRLEIAAGVKEALGLTEEQPAGIKLEKVTVGTGMDAYTVSGLPAAREVLSGENTEKTEKITYFWGGEDETLNQGYIIQKTDAGYSLIPVIKFTAKVGANVGYRNEYKPTESDVVESFKLQRVTGSGVIDCKFNENHTISVGNDADPYARWKLENGELVIEDLQEYSDQKELIDWQVSVNTNSYNKNITDGSGDYFSAGYNNSKVPNYGSDRSTCHNGGTMYINLRGWTSFSANKIWLDEYTEANNDIKKAHRPVTDWALWRYSGKEGVDWNTSSPVRDDESSVITWSVDVTKNSSSYTSVGYQNLSEGLPKYDSDGYPYVYFVRENMSGGDSYEQVYQSRLADEWYNKTLEHLFADLPEEKQKTIRNMLNPQLFFSYHTNEIDDSRTLNYVIAPSKEMAQNVLGYQDGALDWRLDVSSSTSVAYMLKAKIGLRISAYSMYSMLMNAYWNIEDKSMYHLHVALAQCNGSYEQLQLPIRPDKDLLLFVKYLLADKLGEKQKGLIYTPLNKAESESYSSDILQKSHSSLSFPRPEAIGKVDDCIALLSDPGKYVTYDYDPAHSFYSSVFSKFKQAIKSNYHEQALQKLLSLLAESVEVRYVYLELKEDLSKELNAAWEQTSLKKEKEIISQMVKFLKPGGELSDYSKFIRQ